MNEVIGAPAENDPDILVMAEIARHVSRADDKIRPARDTAFSLAGDGLAHKAAADPIHCLPGSPAILATRFQTIDGGLRELDSRHLAVLG